jgi:transcriptional antiterminator RfaH
VRLRSNTVATFDSISSNLPREARHDLLGMRSLGAAPHETYIPRVREQRLRRGKRIETISPLFPAYAFIVIEQQWHRARWSIGVAALIMDGEHPARVPDKVIAGIRAREVRGAVELPKSSGLKPGDHVKILGGPFRGHLALYARMKPHQRVEVRGRGYGTRTTSAESSLNSRTSHWHMR